MGARKGGSHEHQKAYSCGGCVGVSVFGAAFAGEPLPVIELINHLEASIADCNWKARSLKGARFGRMLLHKKTMEDVLDALRTGHAVEPCKLEEALQTHPST